MYIYIHVYTHTHLLTYIQDLTLPNLTLHYTTLHYITLQCIHTYIHTDRQTDRQTCIHTYIHTYIHIHYIYSTYTYICMYINVYIYIYAYCAGPIVRPASLNMLQYPAPPSPHPLPHRLLTHVSPGTSAGTKKYYMFETGYHSASLHRGTDTLRYAGTPQERVC